MSTQWKPRIRRVWIAREGRFEWHPTDPQRVGWASPTAHDWQLYRRAYSFCHMLNSRSAA